MSSHFGKIKSFTSGKKKVLGLLCLAFFPLTPKPKQEPCLFSVNTHPLSTRKRILFVTRIYFYWLCLVSGMQTQTKLVLCLTGRETLVLFRGTLGEKNLFFGTGDFSFSLAADRMNRIIVLFLKQLHNDGYFLSKTYTVYLQQGKLHAILQISG